MSASARRAAAPGPLEATQWNRASPPISGVYGITPDEADTAKLVGRVRDALAGGVRLIQYRNKRAHKTLRQEQAAALRDLTREAGAQLVVNDDIELALSVSADGVHLGRDDRAIDGVAVNIRMLRERAAGIASGHGPFLVGISCYNEINMAREAARAGADYIAFGSFFPSRTKPDAVRADLSLIRELKREYSLPVVAIGGITVENTPQLIDAGVDAVAVISSLFDSADIRLQAERFSLLFSSHV